MERKEKKEEKGIEELASCRKGGERREGSGRRLRKGHKMDWSQGQDGKTRMDRKGLVRERDCRDEG